MKKILFVIVFILSINIKSFAEGGFEAVLNLPLGVSLGIFNGETESIGSEPKINTKAGFDAGVTAQAGYMFVFGKAGLSILGEFGYSYDSFKYYISHSVSAFGGYEEYDLYGSLYTHSIQIGILPKLNFGGFAVGFGGGVKLAMSGTSEIKSIKTLSIAGEYIKTEENIKQNYKSSDYKSFVMPYFKFTFDYSFFFTSKLAFNLGAYFGYDVGLTDKTNNTRTDSFDIGIQLGLRFAPRL